MQNVIKQPHIFLGTGDARPICLVVGDPARAEMFAKLCDTAKEVAYNREYRTFLATKEGAEFLITSHGVGSAGASICFNELIAIGVKCIIRAGTCGTLQPQLHKQGNLVICYAAAKEDGVSLLLEPRGMPAVADPHVTDVLVQTAAEKKIQAHLGITLTSDLFYPSPVLDGTLRTWQKAKVDVVEMEASALFTCSRLGGVKCGAIVAVDGCPFGWADGDYNPSGDLMNKAKKAMAEISLCACIKLAREYQA